jgi:phage replication O-like protein O
MKAEQPLAGYDGNPQIEAGYTRIANELLEAIIRYKFSSRQLNIVLCLIRKTYGYGKKSDALSCWQISIMTGINRSHVSRTIEELVQLNVIIKHPVGRMSHGVLVHELAINKLYDTWVSTVYEKATVYKTAPYTNCSPTVYKTATQPSTKEHTHKERNKTKEIYVELLDYLNLKTNKNFRPVKVNLDLIKARLTEYSIEDIKHVIDVKTSKWLKDEKMNEYLRPATLFNATKFAQYISEAILVPKERGLVN